MKTFLYVFVRPQHDQSLFLLQNRFMGDGRVQRVGKFYRHNIDIMFFPDIDLPYVLPSASVVFFWQTFFGAEHYAALTELETLGGFFDVLPLYVIFLWKNIGINIILITSALTKISPEIYEAAALDGAHGLKLHRKITLPLISPSLFFVGVLSFVNSLKIFKESYLFYNSDYPPNTAYMVQNYMNNHFYKLNYQKLSTAVVIFTLAMAAVIFIWYRLENKMSEGTF